MKELILGEVADHHKFARCYILLQVLSSMSLTTRLEQIFLEKLSVTASEYLTKKLATGCFEFDIRCYLFHDTYTDIFNNV